MKKILGIIAFSLFLTGISSAGNEGLEIFDKLKSLIISVSDSGPGIDAKIIDTVFEPFFTTREDGTGLGLAIVWQIIENHDGKISVLNRDQGGAQFDIHLPLP